MTGAVQRNRGLSQTRMDTKAGLPPDTKIHESGMLRVTSDSRLERFVVVRSEQVDVGDIRDVGDGMAPDDWNGSCRFVSGESRVRVRRCDDARRGRHGRRDWRGEASSQGAALMANIVARRYGASAAFVAARKRKGHAGRGTRVGAWKRRLTGAKAQRKPRIL